MASEYGNDFITLTDDEGGEYVLEHLDTAEINGELYMAFLPADMDEEDEDYGVIILKVVEQDGEEFLAAIENENEEETIFNVFLDRFFDEEE